MKFIISPCSRPLRNGQTNPKNYPYWHDLLMLLTGAGIDTIQIGISGEQKYNATAHAPDLSMKDLEIITKEADGWISVDNFYPHFCHYHKKPGVVLWGKSDPNIFGYPENLNILKDRANLRPQQFAMWEDEPFSPDVFLGPQAVFHQIQNRYSISSTMVLDLSQI